ncbi:MAG TPA: CRISPR-associated endonuclease Cas2 [Candidatus Ozemobacteraceae bacterium]|nr:CRISPR-associated endonuclease Cas2 [Candidatus Ozemobacteraceae bacterium]
MRGQFYIICYDTPSNKRRRKLHAYLKNYAVAVQKSVFETFLDGPTFDRFLSKLEKFIDPAVDSVRIYGMTREAQKEMKVYGFPGLLEDPDHFFIGKLDNPVPLTTEVTAEKLAEEEDLDDVADAL